MGYEDMYDTFLILFFVFITVPRVIRYFLDPQQPEDIPRDFFNF